MALDRDAYFTNEDDSFKIIQQLIIDHPELKSLKWVEPSAGSGSFVKAARKNNIQNIEAYDIHPLHTDVKQNDFLKEDIDLTNCFVYGNPPFGKRNEISIKFIERSFNLGAEYVGFLLLGSFLSYSILSRIKENFSIKSIRTYNVNFIDEENNRVNSGVLKLPMSFIIFEKSNQKFKEIEFDKFYKKTTVVDVADFAVGYKFYKLKNELPEFDGISTTAKFYLKQNRVKEVSLYQCDSPDENLIKYLSSVKLCGDPNERTLNFYHSNYHLLLDLN